MRYSIYHMKPLLQVALDLINAERAMVIASEAVKGGADWIEIGTPLLKSEGVHIIRSMKKQFPHITLVADMKTMDTGSLETEIALKAGADIVSILAVADNSTIADAVKAAHTYGGAIMADLIGCSDVTHRAKDLENLGVQYLCIHVGIDEQMKGKTPHNLVKKIVNTTKLPVAVAGGINSETAAGLISAGALILIVGGAITKAPHVINATKTIKKAMMEKTSIPTDLYKKYDVTEVRKAFSLVSTSNVSDAMHRTGAMKGIRSLAPGLCMVGPALTVKTMDGDWAKPIEAIDLCEPGTVLVIDAQAGTTAIWGELASCSAKTKKLAGVVIDGTVRDVNDIVKMKFPVYCRHTAPNAGEPKGFGEIGGVIICGGQTVHPGDWIIGDDSGVVVVPKQQAQELANRALDVKEHENRIRQEIKQGKTLNTVIDVKKWEKVIG